MHLTKTSAHENWEEVVAQGNYHLYFQCKKLSLNFYLTESDFNSKVLSNPWICRNAFTTIIYLLQQIIEIKSNNKNLFILGKEFNWVISSKLLPLNDSQIPTLLHCSSGSRFFPDISIAISSLALSCSW